MQEFLKSFFNILTFISHKAVSNYLSTALMLARRKVNALKLIDVLFPFVLTGRATIRLAIADSYALERL
jgi:prolipoprotein diacylglyceryltransferase